MKKMYEDFLFMQFVWSQYKRGGELRYEVNFSSERMVFQVCLSVRRKDYTCISWLSGASPNEVMLKLHNWIEKDYNKRFPK